LALHQSGDDLRLDLDLGASLFRQELMPPLWRRQPEGEEDYGGGDLCSPEAEASTDDDQPLE
jgi:hypothetical protein